MPEEVPTPEHLRLTDGLSRAGTRLKGFCITNLFKRLESAGPAFVLSLERHVLRNFVVLYAIEQGTDIPLGPQDAELLDTRFHDHDDALAAELFDDDNPDDGMQSSAEGTHRLADRSELS